jgi:serine protease inhibitor
MLVALALIGCSGVTHSSDNHPPSNRNAMENEVNKSPDGPADSRLVSANTSFGFKLFAEVAKQDAGKNVFISPASIGLALAMTYNGAAGETKQGLRPVETGSRKRRSES